MTGEEFCDFEDENGKNYNSKNNNNINDNNNNINNINNNPGETTLLDSGFAGSP